MNSCKPPQLQSDEEWLEALKSDRPAHPHIHPPLNGGEAESTIRTFIYDSHRTFKNSRGDPGKGHAVLCFIDVTTLSEITAFFNVGIARQRGALKGQNYKTGHNGQFFPAPRSNFRKFWSKLNPNPPSRWASAYKELKRNFGDLILTAPVLTAHNSRGEPFLKIQNPLEEVRIQDRNATLAQQVRRKL